MANTVPIAALANNLQNLIVASGQGNNAQAILRVHPVGLVGYDVLEIDVDQIIVDSLLARLLQAECGDRECVVEAGDVTRVLVQRPEHVPQMSPRQTRLSMWRWPARVASGLTRYYVVYVSFYWLIATWLFSSSVFISLPLPSDNVIPQRKCDTLIANAHPLMATALSFALAVTALPSSLACLVF
jgi:hypothetical protein